MSGRCEFWVTNSFMPLSGCMINLNSPDAWLFLPGVKPSMVVASTYLQPGAGERRGRRGRQQCARSAVRPERRRRDSSCRDFPAAHHFQSAAIRRAPRRPYSQWTYYTGNGITNVSSFKLKRGYQAVFAQSADGVNYSKCYVAQDGDLEVGVLPATLDKQVRFIYVTPWRWTPKKGTAGNPGISLLNLSWWYNWNISSSSSRDLEYVAIRQNQYWPGLGPELAVTRHKHSAGLQRAGQSDQANMSVGTAISAWGDLLATGLRVGSPATTDGGRYNWLYPFVQQADAAGLRVDFVAVHYYWAWNPADPSWRGKPDV